MIRTFHGVEIFEFHYWDGRMCERLICCFILVASVLSTVGSDHSHKSQQSALHGHIMNVLFPVSDDLKASGFGCYGDRNVQYRRLEKIS